MSRHLSTLADYTMPRRTRQYVLWINLTAAQTFLDKHKYVTSCWHSLALLICRRTEDRDQLVLSVQNHLQHMCNPRNFEIAANLIELKIPVFDAIVMEGYLKTRFKSVITYQSYSLDFYSLALSASRSR